MNNIPFHVEKVRRPGFNENPPYLMKKKARFFSVTTDKM